MKVIPRNALFSAACTILFCALCLVTSAAGFPLATKMFKMAASFSFLFTAWHAGARHSAYGRVLFAGLICSSFGDYFLLSGGDGRFLAGLVSFLLAHVAYCIAYGIRGVRLRPLGIAAAVMAVVALFVIQWVWPHVPEDMQVPVVAYTIVIGLMVALAGGLVSKPGGRLILLGAAMFYISDIFVARQQFVSPGSINALLGLPLYFGGQAVLALTIAFVNADATTSTTSEALPDLR